jgi:hypothetical protein
MNETMSETRRKVNSKIMYMQIRIFWMILAIASMFANQPDLATMFLVGAIYCRLMEVTQ